MLEKGFPYDDVEFNSNEKAKQLAGVSVKQIIGQMEGHNITKDALRNLVTDKASPLSNSGLVQIAKSDDDNLSTLFDHNVTRGALKNLVTDRPAPITTKLAQKSDADNLSTLFDHNVTRGALKNLVTDHPAPITMKLAQKSDDDNLSTLFDHNVTRGALKNLVTDRPAPITTKLAQLSNPTENPPMNNWSVNQPSPPHAHGMGGNDDLGMREIIVDGINFDLVQQRAEMSNPESPSLTQLVPTDPKENQPGNFLIVDRDSEHMNNNI